MHRGQEKDGETAETDRQAIKVWTSSNFQNKYYLCLSYPKSVCLCANVVIRINRGSALHEHHTIIFRKSHLGCFDLTDESIYMSEWVDSQRSLLASIRIILYLCRLGNRDVWERGKNRGLVEQRGGRRGKDEEIYLLTLGLGKRHPWFLGTVPHALCPLSGRLRWKGTIWFCCSIIKPKTIR